MKKKKLTFNSLAFGNLKHRKKQYTLLIIGIILSMVFSASVPFLISSAYSSAQATKNAFYGAEDIIVPDIQQFEKCRESLNNSFSNVGYANVFGLISKKDSEKNSGVCIASFDEKSKEMYLYLESGRLPEKNNEIAIEEEALVRMGINASVGDKLHFDLYPKKDTELMEKSQSVEFVLTGILKSKRPNIEALTILDYTRIPAAVVSDDYLIAPGGKVACIAYASADGFINRKQYNEQFSSFYEKYGEGNGNVRVMEISALSRYDILSDFSGISSPVVLLAVLSLVFMLVADIGIINAFSANLKERKKQIGLLRSVGATKRQIIKVYGRESFILCLICAPVSVIVSLCIVAIIVPFFGENYVFEPEFWVIPVSVALSIVFVLVASFIPLVSASRISPMQAIRNTELSRKFKNKKIKSQKNYDASKLLAKRNITLFRGKGVITSIIICISVFVSCFGFSLTKALEDDFDVYKHDYVVSGGNYISNGFLSNYKQPYRGLTENNLNEIILNDNVESVSEYKVTSGYLTAENFTEYMHNLCYLSYFYNNQPENVWVTKENYKEYTRTVDAEVEFVKQNAELTEDIVPVSFNGLDEETLGAFKDCVVSGDIDIDKLNSGEEVILFVPKNLTLTVSHLEESHKYSLLYASEVSVEQSPELAEDIILSETACHFKAGDKINLGWLYADEKPEFDGDIYHLAPGQEPIEYEKEESKVEIGAVIYGIPRSTGAVYEDMTFYEGASIITSIDGFDKLTNSKVDYKTFGINLNTECTDEINSEFEKILGRFSAVTDGNFSSSFEKREKQEENMRATLIVIIAVAVLFFTACGSMVNNSITARIRESKKEIGTLRAVGATTKDINSSYIRQLVSILGWGTIAGFAMFFIFYGLYYLIFTSMGDTTDDIKVTVIETLVGVILLFVSCSLNMFSKVKKEMKNSIVENIREL